MAANTAKPFLRIARPATIHPINMKLASEFIETRLGTKVTPEKIEKLARCIEEIEQ